MSAFLRPLPLIALGVMALNDHWLRLACPSWWTGKLSDVAVVCYFPALLVAIYGLAPGVDEAPTRTRIRVAALLTALALASINLSTTCAGWYVTLLETIDVFDVAQFRYTTDPTDLLALAALPLAIADGDRAVEGS